MQFLLLGMSHSGASLMARLFQLMDIYSPLERAPHLKEESSPSSISQLNQRVIQSLDLDWNRVHTFSCDQISDSVKDRFNQDARSLLDELNQHQNWIIHDRLLSLLMPLWRPLLDDPVCLFADRHPMLIGQDLSAFHDYPMAFGMALWEKYTIQSLADTQKLPHLLMSYNDLLEAPVQTGKKWRKQLKKMGTSSLKRLEDGQVEEYLGPLPPFQKVKESLSDGIMSRQQKQLHTDFLKGRLFNGKSVPDLSFGALEQLEAFEQQEVKKRALYEDKQRHEQTVIELSDKDKQLDQRHREYEHTVIELSDKNKQLDQRHREYDLLQSQLSSKVNALNQFQQNVDNLRQEQYRHKIAFESNQNELTTLRIETAQLQGQQHKAIRLIERMQQATSNLLQSWTWRIGRFFVKTACWLMFKRPDATGLDHMSRLLTDYFSWRDMKKKRGSESVGTSDIAPASSVTFESSDPATTTPQTSIAAQDTNPSSSPAIFSGLGRRKIMFVSPNLPDFDQSGGGKRATRLLALLAEECDVYIFTMGEKPDKYIQELNRCGVVVPDTYDYQELMQQIPHIDVLIYAWFYTYFDAAALRQLYPDAKLIMDSVDVHWVREERSLGHLEGLTEEKYLENKRREMEVYHAVNLVWAVTESDRAAILKELPESDVRIVSNVHPPVLTEYKKSGKKSILFFGGFGHYPNVFAAKALAEEILPKVREKVPEARLIIAGAKATEEVIELGRLPEVEFRGFIEEHDIEALYDESFISVVPLRMGAGIKIKICEAIAYMTPVVTSSIGNEGIHLKHGEEGLIADDPDEIASLVVQAMGGMFDLETMTKNAQLKMQQLVGPDIVKAQMLWSITRGVCICIVTHNRLNLLIRCINSILEHTTYCNYKIMVYSNACTDGTKEYLNDLAAKNNKIITILSDKNDVFVRPNNHMMMRHVNSDVVLLNNDVVVTPNWLNALHKAAYASESYGIVGAKILYPDNRLQEFGSEIFADGTGRNIGKGEDPDLPEYNRISETGYVSGCTMFIKRSTIEKTGGFDDAFHPCYFEDADYCYTAKEHGLSTVVTPDSIVYHDEGGTAGTDTNEGYKAYQKVNAEKFLKKHTGKDNSIDWKE